MDGILSREFKLENESDHDIPSQGKEEEERESCKLCLLGRYEQERRV